MGRYDDDDDDVKTSKSRYDDDDTATDEAPRRRSKYSEEDDGDDSSAEEIRQLKDAAKSTIKRGWAAAENVKSSDNMFANRLQLSDEPVVVKFLEDDPYVSYKQHWIERQGQKSFTCIADLDPKGCPLCAAGDRPVSRYSFNVALLNPDENGEPVDPILRSFDVGNKVIDALKAFHQDPRQGPLPKHYWAISRSGKKQTSQTNLNVIKERDLLEEWDITPPTDEALDKVRKQAYTPDIVFISTRKTLLEIANEELGD